jgi:hypothetical protein
MAESRRPISPEGGDNVIAEHFARRWRKAGLIDDKLTRRIIDREIANRRPVVLWPSPAWARWRWHSA